MRRLAFLAVLSLALAAAGAAAWRQHIGLPGRDLEAAQEVQQARDELALDPLLVPVLQEGKVTHQLALKLTLAFTEPKAKTRALALMPRLQDALLEELHSLYSLRRVRNAGFDSLLVHERLALASERVLGAGEIARITLSVTESPKSGT